jgi:hypothetical protein
LYWAAEIWLTGWAEKADGLVQQSWVNFSAFFSELFNNSKFTNIFRFWGRKTSTIFKILKTYGNFFKLYFDTSQVENAL